VVGGAGMTDWTPPFTFFHPDTSNLEANFQVRFAGPTRKKNLYMEIFTVYITTCNHLGYFLSHKIREWPLMKGERGALPAGKGLRGRRL
jgi:hypothetical protein